MTTREQGPDALRALRAQLDEVDTRLVELAARRQQLVSEIGRCKQVDGRQLRDFRREREVIDRIRVHAGRVALDPAVAEDLFKRLIEASLTRQEQERIRLAGRGEGRHALVIGGGGRMGRWLAGFLDTQGYHAMVADPAIDDNGRDMFRDWRSAPLDAGVIAIAAPPAQTARVIDELAKRRVPGLVFDIASLKTPLIDSLQQAAAAGLRVCSLHPMFGPDTRLLSDQHVLVMDVGCGEAVDEATALFADTMAQVVRIDLDEHDRLMAPVLGLSHALNIAFFTALANSGIDSGDLAAVSSTTFRRQLEVALDVAGESPALYYEIQRLNRHGAAIRAALGEAIQALSDCVDRDDADGFAGLMRAGRRYLDRLGATRSARPDSA